MKKRRKILIIVFMFIFIVAIAAYMFINNIKSSGLVNYNEEVKIEGLKSEVTVYRDNFGVPHVFAENEEDLYKVTGYISAQDRMWQMDLLRRVTQGRLSEIFGEDMIKSDVILRSLRMAEKSEMVLEEISPEMLKALENFADGVNQYIEDYNDNLSFEFRILGYKPEKWKPIHSLNLIGYMAWNLETGWGTESIIYKVRNKVSEAKFKELLPDLSLQKTQVYPDFELNEILVDTNLISSIRKINKIAPPVFRASNNWVVAGKKSTTGMPIFANDMHLGLMVPGIWSQIHQHVEGKLDVTGVILPGQPFVIAGHNADISWGMTNVMLDGADFYIEKINPDNKNQYKYDGEWKDMEVRKELINVKGEEKPVEKEIRFTHRGPIINEFKEIENNSISMHWIGNERSNELRAVYMLNRAKNWTEFRDAVSSFKSVSQNIAYADTKGNIGIQCCAGIPERKAPGYLFFPGDTSLYDWNSFVPFDSLPYIYNPECGYVFSANNRTTGNDSPYYISEWFDLPNRANRIEQMLTAKDKLSIDDFKKMQNDQHSVLTDDMKPVILKYVKNMKKLTSDEQKAFDLLKNWDNVYSKDEVAPLIFEEYYIIFSKNIMKDEMGDTLYEEFLKMDLLTNYLTDKVIKNEGSVWCDDVNTKETETLEDIIQKSFKELIPEFKEKYSKNITETKWGDIHKLALIQPLGKVKMLDFAFNLNRTLRAGGSYHTVSPYSYDFKDPYIANHGASHRHIYNTANYDESYSIIPTGVSGIPASKHYCDQTDMYINGEYHPDYISLKKIKKNAVYIAFFSEK
ncbi:MAG: penicillin acylase family protein [Bacteroidales bacterium]|nr:penicillin acylase family protein [Bacteroidales bacterium]